MRYFNKRWMPVKETDSEDFELNMWIMSLNLSTYLFTLVISRLFIVASRISSLEAIVSADSLNATTGRMRHSHFKGLALSSTAEWGVFDLAIMPKPSARKVMEKVNSSERFGGISLFPIWHCLRKNSWSKMFSGFVFFRITNSHEKKNLQLSYSG